MIVLGIDTSTRQSSVAIGTEEGVISCVTLSMGRSHEEVLLPAVRHMLDWTGVSLGQVGGIAVGIGPGLFTGLRVGVQTAKSLAHVLKVPMIGLPSLDVLAFPLRHARGLVCAVIDARRGEVFFAMYRPVPGGMARTGGFAVGTPEKLIAELEALAEEAVLAGDGALRYREQLEELGPQVELASPAFAFPQASAMIDLSIPRFLREEFDRVADVIPLYLRKSDAEIAWDKRARAG